jgi:hypothetical protein
MRSPARTTRTATERSGPNPAARAVFMESVESLHCGGRAARKEWQHRASPRATWIYEGTTPYRGRDDEATPAGIMRIDAPYSVWYRDGGDGL